MKTAKSLACVTDNKNDNFSSHENNLFSWNTRWGNLGLKNFQWLGRTGIIGKISIKFRSTTVNPHPCAACQLGKQEHTPRGDSCTENHNGGSIKVNQLDPGDLIFSDQYESRLKGRHFTARGHSLLTQKYHGGTLFCDAASVNVIVICQMVLTGTETVQSKLQSEQEAAAVGVPINQYCTKNGVYTSKDFVNEIISKGRGIKHGRVGVQHHNSVAENSIKTNFHTYYTMMIRSSLRWPEHNECDIWHKDLSHAACWHNETPHMLYWLFPTELWSHIK